ncbi:protein shisa-2 homolog [Hemicordylus capensis]|uniref:protein shisa-2 homolog n=1 Tax=Hemicordylus capensis TaxID=884348 RepID=UPI002304A5D1|nr:protein shisa-2 homolog [Hemicordylus capensis]
MDKILYCTLLLLLLFLALEGCSARTGGEVCRGWAYGTELPEGAVYCPSKPGGEGAQFCCGTCALPYCCSSEEDRLDPSLCYSHSWLKAGTEPPVKSEGPGNLYKVGLIILAAVIVLLVVFISVFICRFCYWLRFRLLDYCRERQQETESEDGDPSTRLNANVPPNGYGTSQVPSDSEPLV